MNRYCSNVAKKTCPSSAKSTWYFPVCLWGGSWGPGSSDKKAKAPPQPPGFLVQGGWALADSSKTRRKMAQCTLGGVLTHVLTDHEVLKMFQELGPWFFGHDSQMELDLNISSLSSHRIISNQYEGRDNMLWMRIETRPTPCTPSTQTLQWKHMLVWPDMWLCMSARLRLRRYCKDTHTVQ